MTNLAAAVEPESEPEAAAPATAIAVTEAEPSPPSLALDASFRSNPSGSFVAILALMTGVFLCVIAFSNRLMAPWLHVDEYKERIALTLNAGQNFAVHDLNVDIRGIRQAQVAHWETAPDVMLLGASHWQEAHAELAPGWDVFNGHVHRDYYDDFLAMVEVLLQHNKLPNHLVISIRDSTFTPPELRTDALWHPFIEEYRQMESRLDLEPRAWRHDFHSNTLLDLFSVPLGLASFDRWTSKPETPGPTFATTKESLDVLLADGSIKWSKEHLSIFTFERALQESLNMAEAVLNKEHVISEDGIVALDALFKLLKDKGVGVTLVHPPFNPSFYAVIEGTHYERHLEKVHDITVSFAEKYGFGVASSFDPRDVGCEASMYIDSEHGRPACLKKVMTHITDAIAAARGGESPSGPMPAALVADGAGAGDKRFADDWRREAALNTGPAAVRSQWHGRSGTAAFERAHATAPNIASVDSADAQPLVEETGTPEVQAPATPEPASDVEVAARETAARLIAALPPETAAPETAPASPVEEPAAPAAASSAPQPAAPIEGGYVAQLLATFSQSEAQTEMAKMYAAHGDVLPPGALAVAAEPGRGGRTLYTLRSQPFAGVSEARALCKSLGRGPNRCFAANAR